MSVRNIISSSDPTKAVLELPKLTNSQKVAITNPLQGDIVYDKSAGDISYYDGTNWQYVANLSNSFRICGWNLNTSEACGSGTTVIGSSGSHFTNCINNGQPISFSETNGVFTLVSGGGWYRINLHMIYNHAGLIQNNSFIVALRNTDGDTYTAYQLSVAGNSEFPPTGTVDIEGIFQFNVGDNVSIELSNSVGTIINVVGTTGSALGLTTYLNFQKVS